MNAGGYVHLFLTQKNEREYVHVRTDVRAPAFSVDGVHCRHYEHKPEKECKEQEGIEKHSIRNPPGPNFHFDEFSNTFPWEHCDVPQTG